MEENRAATLGLGFFLALGGAAAAWWGAAGLTAIVRGVSSGARTVLVGAGDASALPAGAAMLLLGLMLLARPADRWQRRLFAAALAALAGVLILPVAVYLAAGWWLPAQGYRRCAKPLVGARFVTSIWTRDGSCPDAMPR